MNSNTEPFPEFRVIFVKEVEENEALRVDVRLIRDEFFSVIEYSSVCVTFNTPLPLSLKRELEKMYVLFECTLILFNKSVPELTVKADPFALQFLRIEILNEEMFIVPPFTSNRTESVKEEVMERSVEVD